MLKEIFLTGGRYLLVNIKYRVAESIGKDSTVEADCSISEIFFGFFCLCCCSFLASDIYIIFMAIYYVVNAKNSSAFC
ncbi:hypothetical protein A9J41_03200 [Laribacter hongkongensis]|nr:hypothetical protein [Laribacter hongkongensis]